MSKDNMLELKPGSDNAELINALKTFAEIAPEIARTKIAYYKAYISEGFTPEQAVELCKSLSI